MPSDCSARFTYAIRYVRTNLLLSDRSTDWLIDTRPSHSTTIKFPFHARRADSIKSFPSSCRLVHLRGKLPSPTQISYFSNKRIVSRCKSFVCAILTRYSRLDESRIFPPDISSGEKKRIEKFSESLDHRRLQSTFFHLFRLKRNGTEENIRFESWLRSRHKYVAELAEILIYL